MLCYFILQNKMAQHEKCTIYDSKKENLIILGKKIFDGEVVVFPCETVYGIGASLFDETAINTIYKLKNRPHSNPLIVHCLGIHDSQSYLDLNHIELSIFNKLIANFSPGPITYLCKASDNLPNYILKNNSYVGIRIPENKVFRDLLQYSNVPICAPSANITNKTSSTSIDHIKKYFEHKNVSIINDNNYICKYGIESTIVKIDNNILTIMRHGAILESKLEEFVKKFNQISDTKIVLEKEVDKIKCPGQHKLHYAPEKPIFIAKFIDFSNSNLDFPKDLSNLTKKYFEKVLFIDYNSLGIKYKKFCYGYVDLSEKGDINEAMFNLYNVFHQSDKLDCEKIFVYDFSFVKDSKSIWDKILKASENKAIAIPLQLL